MKAVILARVSTKDQEDGHSLDAQIANLELYAQRKSLDIIQRFTIIESSTKGERPEFEKMISFIRGRKEKIALVVDTVDRLQRGFKETPVLNDLMERRILELHFVKEGNILSKDANSTQKMMWNMGVVMSQSYTDQLSDNVKRSIRHKTSNGEWSGPAPLGYLNAIDPDTGRKTVIPDPERAFLIKKLFQEYATGAYSQAELIRKAKGWGLRTLKGHAVSTQTFNQMVMNPFYYGVMKVKGELHPHIYSPIIGKEIFDACQAVRIGKGRTQAVVETKHPFLLRGMVKCAVSGRTVTCDLKKGKHVYLICRDPGSPEKKVWIKESVILDQIRDVFRSIQIPDLVLTEIIDNLKETHESEKAFHYASIKSLHKESEEVTRKLDQVLDVFLDKSITKDEYDRKHTQLVARQQEINQRLEQHHSGNEQFKIALTSLITLASHAYDLFECSTIDEKRQLIGYVFSNLEIKGETLCFSLKKPFNLFVELASYQEWLRELDSNQRPLD